MNTLGTRGDRHARRRAERVIRSNDVAAKVFGELAERFRSRAGGYTRVMKTRSRIGDAAPMSIVALLGAGEGGGAAAAAPAKPAGKKRAKAAKSEKAAAKAAKPAKKAGGKKSGSAKAAAGKAARAKAPKATRTQRKGD
jgi:large subunit ribosomal protein L17